MSNKRNNKQPVNSSTKSQATSSSGGQKRPLEESTSSVSASSSANQKKYKIIDDDDEDSNKGDEEEEDVDDLQFSADELAQAKKIAVAVTQPVKTTRVAEEARLKQFGGPSLDKITELTKVNASELNINTRALRGVLPDFPISYQSLIHPSNIDYEHDLSTPSYSGTPGNRTISSISSSSTSSPSPYILAQDFSYFNLVANRKQTKLTYQPLSTTLKLADIMCNLDIGEFITSKVPNLMEHHRDLQYPYGLVLTEDGRVYNIDPILNVIVALQLHYVCRHGLDADNVFNTVILLLSTKGCFAQYHNSWTDKQFMSKELVKAINNDTNLRPKISRIAEGFKTKLGKRSQDIVESLLALKTDYVLPNQNTGIILRMVS